MSKKKRAAQAAKPNSTPAKKNEIKNALGGSRAQARIPRRPVVYFTQEVDDYMTEIAGLTDTEVGGLGYVTVTESGDFVVDKVFVIPQTASAAHVSFKEGAIIDAVIRAMEEGRPNDLRFSWHSHGDLGVFWSGTDEGGINTYLAGGAPWLLSAVINREGHCLTRLDIKDVEPVGRVVYDELATEVFRASRTGGQAKRDLDEFVELTYWTTNTSGYRNRGVQSGDGWTTYDNLAWDDVDEETVERGAVKELMMPSDDDLERAAEEDERDAVIADDLKLTLAEVRRLTEAGHKPEEMSADDALDALIALDLKDAGIGSESDAQRVG